MICHADTVLSHQILAERCLNRANAQTERTIDHVISRLRAKLEPHPAHPIYIRRALQHGYYIATPQHQG